jgi:cytochrome c-type biogenesis protein
MTSLSSFTLLSLAFSAGSATFFAPCAFPLLPGYLSYFLSDTASAAIDGEQSTDGSLIERVQNPVIRAVFVSVSACLGMTLVYVGLAGTTVALGAGTLSEIAVLELVVGLVFIVGGITMALGWTLDRVHIQLPERRRTFGGFFVFGVLYAAAAAGCTAPLFIAVVARGITAGPTIGVGLAVAYALGMSVLLIGVTLLSALGGSSVTTTLSQHTNKIYRFSGILLIFSGISEIYYYFYGFSGVIPV